MKVTNWKRKLAGALLAAGIWVPGVALAQNIPLGDPSFEDFSDLGGDNYAYASDYRPTSAWVDDLYSPGGYVEDDADSNWLYNSSYDINRRPAPRTGVQAMHGGNNYNAQIAAGAVFEAGMAYTFSVWSQGDSDADGATSRVWMYIFDGSSPLASFGQSLQIARYAPDTGDFMNRVDGSTQAESQAMWTQISLTHQVVNDAPEVGQPIGVAFWGAGDASVDDATLVAAPGAFVVLEVNTNNGGASLINETGAALEFDYYEITSATDALSPAGWDSLQDQDFEGNGAPGNGNGWEEFGGISTSVLGESFLQGSSMLADQASIDLGNPFNPSVPGGGTGSATDLVFRYGLADGTLESAFIRYVDVPVLDEADFDRDGDVDGDDFLLWQGGFGTSSGAEKMDGDYDNDGDVDGDDFLGWQAEFGNGSGNGSAAVPEPSTLGLFTLILAGLGAGAIRRSKKEDAV